MAKSKSRRRARSAPRKKPAPQSEKRGKEVAVAEAPKDTPAEKSDKPAMDRRSRFIVWSLMGILLVLFVLIAWLAPDPTHPDRNAAASTVLWRLVFLLVPLGVMYGLLWWDKILRLLRR